MLATLQKECEEALSLLAGQSVGGAELVGTVRNYVESLELVVNKRGAKLKEAASSPARRREVVGRLLEDGAAFSLQVPPYDLAWLADLVTEDEVVLVLRSIEPAEEGQVWRVAPASFVVVEEPATGDLVLGLRVRTFGELADGSGESHFEVLSFVTASEEEVEEASSDDVTASRICDALSRGTVRVEVRRMPNGIEVHFEDVA